MKRNHVAVIVAGLVLSAMLAVISIYLTGIGIILVIALAMSFQIMADTERLIDLAVVLSENAKSIIIINRGNMLIRNIAVTIIPLNVEFAVPELAVDGRFTFDLQQMINEARAEVEFEDVGGRKYKKAFELSALHNDDDLLKPMMPLFDWKEKK